ncbi:MAG: lipoate--protein ligase family protein [Planctomycetales bacterium]|nr:lipoate--protein ligase family protein [Planctomycetales bacterium]
MQYLELTLPSIAENLALDEALLEEAQASDMREETLRIWQAHSPFVVLGRSSRVDDEVDQACAAEQSVPVLRRVSGGATVVAGPGCMFYALVLSLEQRPHLRMLDVAHQFVMVSLQSALKSLLPRLEFNGTCDLVVSGRKVSGNSVRLVRDWMLYHGTLLLNMDLSLADRLLKHPPREPEYRGGRSHADFLANLQIPYSAVAAALRSHWQADSQCDSVPARRIESLVRDKYSQQAWNLAR